MNITILHSILLQSNNTRRMGEEIINHFNMYGNKDGLIVQLGKLCILHLPRRIFPKQRECHREPESSRQFDI